MQIFRDGKVDEDIIIRRSTRTSDGQPLISISSISNTELSKNTIYTTDMKHLLNISLKIDSKVADNLYLLKKI